ncbi:sensor domain-containing diguanylate cyclase/phosphohydrolase [Syntrophomonas palmitatica]|uniref:sensor domain-containing diguanylate cyclase/phosphohydrolase n=1 Tax=Syntrophomonas palmitatica TaxID=402877 RepID=UPI0006D05710|nr:diguanylate cyclase [Syntrophomonas palmitatica]
MPPYEEDLTRQEKLREQLIGLGERSLRKNYYPLLQQSIQDLKRFRALLDESYDLIFLLQLPGGTIVDINESACRKLGYDREKILFSSYDIYMARIAKNIFLDYAQKPPGYRQTSLAEFRKCDGAIFPVEVNFSLVSFEDHRYVVVVARDITERLHAEEELRQAHLMLEQRVKERTEALLQLSESLKAEIAERKKAEDQLRFLSLHDFATGLYNRAYFAEEIKRLEAGRHYPVSLIMCDLDGLKLINDALGHEAGDQLIVEAANVLRSAVREGDVVARVGGDEFAILIAHTAPRDVTQVIERIKALIKQHNKADQALPLSISLGYATSIGKDKRIDELYCEADNNMYKNKLANRRFSDRIIKTALKNIYKLKDFAREGHLDRLRDICLALADQAHLSDESIKRLILLAEYHDIGKLIISDHILMKPGPLNAEERALVKAHCETGQRIALAVPELVLVADLILKHHEAWDGSGYPLGLKEFEIPLECRIVAVADAFEAMTGVRPYRNPISVEEALAELKKSAGRQFDPILVEHMFNIMRH